MVASGFDFCYGVWLFCHIQFSGRDYILWFHWNITRLI